MSSRHLKKEMLLFLASGGVAALINFFSRKLLGIWLPLGVAVTIAYILGMITAFILFRQHVFTNNDAPLLVQTVRFFVVNVLAIIQTLIITLVLAEKLLDPFSINILGYPLTHEDVSHGIGITIPTISSYLGHKFYSFRKKQDSESTLHR